MYRQSRLYDGLVTSFVTHWRSYLVAHSLGSSWLNKYASRADPVTLWPSRGHQKPTWNSVLVAANIPESPKASANPKPLGDVVDAPLDSEIEDMEGGDEVADAKGDEEGNVDSEDMFADD